jgi:hypothetical protein
MLRRLEATHNADISSHSLQIHANSCAHKLFHLNSDYTALDYMQYSKSKLYNLHLLVEEAPSMRLPLVALHELQVTACL